MTEILICSENNDFIKKKLKEIFPDNFSNWEELPLGNIDLIISNNDESFHVYSSTIIPLNNCFDEIIIDPKLQDKENK